MRAHTAPADAEMLSADAKTYDFDGDVTGDYLMVVDEGYIPGHRVRSSILATGADGNLSVVITANVGANEPLTIYAGTIIGRALDLELGQPPRGLDYVLLYPAHQLLVYGTWECIRDVFREWQLQSVDETEFGTWFHHCEQRGWAVLDTAIEVAGSLANLRDTHDATLRRAGITFADRDLPTTISQVAIRAMALLVQSHLLFTHESQMDMVRLEDLPARAWKAAVQAIVAGYEHRQSLERNGGVIDRTRDPTSMERGTLGVFVPHEVTVAAHSSAEIRVKLPHPNDWRAPEISPSIGRACWLTPIPDGAAHNLGLQVEHSTCRANPDGTL